MQLGTKVRAERKKREWSLAELSRRSGLAANHIGHIETGRIENPRADVLQKLAVALGLSVDEILGKARRSA